MRPLKKYRLFFCIVFFPLALIAAPRDSINWINFDGTLKTKSEWSLNTGKIRFNLRNLRAGVFGDINRYVAYRVQVELNSEGNFAVLDGFLKLKPVKNVLLQIGQTAVPFENSYLITPAEILFVNRVFIGKFFTPSSRDIGVTASYTIGQTFPFTMEGGVFNGGVLNSPQWTKRPSWTVRFLAGSLEHFRTSVKIYRYPHNERDWLFLGADVSYRKNNLLLQAEVMNRHDYYPEEDYRKEFTGAYLQGAYTFYYSFLKLFHSITPALRWDAMTYDLRRRGIDVNRITVGIAFGLTEKLYDSCFRINFENYFKHHDTPEFHGMDEQVSANKVTLELLVKF